jgi:hypothetical protein
VYQLSIIDFACASISYRGHIAMVALTKYYVSTNDDTSKLLSSLLIAVVAHCSTTASLEVLMSKMLYAALRRHPPLCTLPSLYLNIREATLHIGVRRAKAIFSSARRHLQSAHTNDLVGLHRPSVNPEVDALRVCRVCISPYQHHTE